MKTLLLICTILFSSLLSSAQSSEIALSQLKSVPFTAGDLKITFTNVKGRMLVANLSNYLGYRGSIRIEVENISRVFATFNPEDVSVVDRDDHQADILGLEINSTNIFPAETRRIAPKATIKAAYVLTDKFEFPVRIYYAGKVLCTVTE